MFDDAWPAVIDCRDPATGELLGEVPDMREGDVRASLDRARLVQPAWESRPASARLEVLRAVLDRIVRTQDELCRIAAHDSGETMLDAMAHEVLPLCRNLHALQTAAATTPRPSAGVVGLFAPDSLPLRSLVLPVARVLVAGGAAIIKVSARLAWSSVVFAEMIRDILAEHDLPRDLLQVITGDMCNGEALAHAGCDHLEFAGTEQASRGVAAAAARSHTPLRMQLDPCGPLVVGQSDDPEAALQPVARWVFGGAGQLHGGAPLVCVHRRHYDRFVRAAASLVARLRFGSPLRHDVDCGPLIAPGRSAELTVRLRNAQRLGARIHAGGAPHQQDEATFFEPTLVGPVAAPMEICVGRTLGPVMAVFPFEHRQELSAMPSPARTRSAELERALQAIPLYPARPSTFALLESLVRARYGRGFRRRCRAALSASRHGLDDLRTRARTEA